jgi:hypothetical protein
LVLCNPNQVATREAAGGSPVVSPLRTPAKIISLRTIGQAAIQKGYRALYPETPKLLDDFAEATIDATRRECVERYVSVPLLIIDNLGMRKSPMTAAEHLLEIVMRRYGRASTSLVESTGRRMGQLLGDSAAVTAMLHRLPHPDHVLELVHRVGTRKQTCLHRKRRGKTTSPQDHIRWTGFDVTTVGRFCGDPADRNCGRSRSIQRLGRGRRRKF